ncbi:MAG: hypothetical protein LLG40_09755 [Deltaproteobacteria bacterium]|nr:hypothetical protein [Deltaproteobacteria bacterium]
MKKLSSGSTFFYKRIFPVLWFGFIIFFLSTALLAESKGTNSDDMIVIFVTAVFMAVIGYVVMKNLLLDLMDEVYDEGSSLLFKNKGKTVRVNLIDIKNVSYSVAVNPPRVTLSLRCKTEFGDELSFSPPASLIPFKKNHDIAELIDRIDRARG